MGKVKEILRVDGLYNKESGETRVTSDLPYRNAPLLCGHLLADIVRHFEQIFEEEGLEDGLELMLGSFLREWKRGPSPIVRLIRPGGPEKPTSPDKKKEKLTLCL